jgi:hypothetical protein
MPIHRATADGDVVGEETIDAGIEQGAHVRDRACLAAAAGIVALPQAARQEVVLGSERVGHDLQSGGVRGSHQRGCLAQAAIRVHAHHVAEARTEDVGVGGDRAQALGARHLPIRRTARGGTVRGLRVRRAQQLQQADVRPVAVELAAQRAQVADFERLDHHRSAAGVGMRSECLEQPVLHRQPARAEVGGLLDLGDQPDHATTRGGFVRHQRHDLVERRHRVQAVVRGATQRRDTLPCAQRAQFFEGEVLDEPAFDRAAVDLARGPAIGECGMRRDIGGAADLVFVPCHQHAVAGRDQVGLDVVGAVLDRARVGGQRVLRQCRARTAVGDDERPPGRRRLVAGRCVDVVCACSGHGKGEDNGKGDATEHGGLGRAAATTHHRDSD